MLVILMIDLMEGRPSGSRRATSRRRRIYARHPAEKAEEFARAGATLLHVVDLDGARAGWPVNLDAVRAICAVPGLEVELGGGLRSLPSRRCSRSACATWCSGRRRWSGSACRGLGEFLGQVRTGIDARNGEVKIAGWPPAHRPLRGGRRAQGSAASGSSSTPTSRTGMFTGVDEGAARIQARPIPVVASGGVASLADVEACRGGRLAGVIGQARSTSAASTSPLADRRGGRSGTPCPRSASSPAST